MMPFEMEEMCGPYLVLYDGKEVTLLPQAEEPIEMPSIISYCPKILEDSISSFTLELKPNSKSLKPLRDIFSRIRLLEEFGIDPTSEAAGQFIFGELKS
jgi:hypothetical protein